MCILCHLPKFGFGANMGFVDMVNQIMSGMVIQFTRKLILKLIIYYWSKVVRSICVVSIICP